MGRHLEVRNLSFGYGDNHLLSSISFSVSHGEWVALLGANGSGKSTTFRLLAGLLPFSDGEVAYEGVSVRSIAGRARFGYAVEPEDLPYGLTGREYLNLVRTARKESSYGKLTEESLCKFSLSKYLDRRIGEYSLGTKKKIGISAAMIGRPSCLLLDESLEGVDAFSASWLKRELSRQVEKFDLCVFMATHSLEVVYAHCTRAMVLSEGAIRFDGDVQKMAREMNLSQFQHEIIVHSGLDESGE